MENNLKNIPMYLIDDINGWYWGNKLTDWDIDYRGAGRGWKKEDMGGRRKLVSVLDTFPTTAKRDINEQFEGKLTFEVEYNLISGEGFFFDFSNKTDEMFKIVHRGGYFTANGKKLFKADYGVHIIRLILDIDKGEVQYFSDGKYIGKCSFTGNARSMSRFMCGFGKEDIGEAHLEHNVKLHKDYLCVDRCAFYHERELSDDYTVTNEKGKSTVKYVDYYNKEHTWRDYSGKLYAYKIKAGAQSSTNVVRKFDRASGNIVFEARYYLPKKNSKVTFSLCKGDTKVVSVFDEYSALCCKDGVLREHNGNVWQTLRINANTKDKTALVWLNGKKTSVIGFDADGDFLDSFRIDFDADKASELWYVDLVAYVQPPEPEDYVPEPVVPKKKGDYYVGMNICSIWRTGTHKGWNCISPFEENKPLLGFYDEGVPETSDWELKWMAEHGIDFQLYCWYPTLDHVPFVRNSSPAAIYHGHLSAKYSDKVKFALLFEANGTYVLSAKTFREIYVPNWLDYFFSDDRYMSVDNKAVMSIYAPKKLMACFGSPEAFVTEMNYLRSKVKELGYDDLIIMACGENDPIYKQYGIDAVHAYNWGALGADPEFTKDRIRTSSKTPGGTHVVPTVSTGFNSVAWHGERHDQMSPEDMESCLTWIRDDILTQYDKNSWQSKLVMLSTWNESGEGTYMMPSGLNRFGYLAAVRKVFTEDKPHFDVAPTEEQKKRICGLFPMDRKMLASLDKERKAPEYNVVKKYEFKTQADVDKWEFDRIAKLELRDGILYGESVEKSPVMMLRDKEFLPFDADKVVKIRVNIRTYKEDGKICCVCVGFSRNSDGSFHPETYYSASVPDRIAPLEYKVNNIPRMPWEGKITGIKIHPVYAAGHFELESVEFLDLKPEYKFIVDGVSVDMPIYPEFDKAGNAYLPFDPVSALTELVSLYYEWVDSEQKLIIKAKHDYEFVKGEKTYTRDGKEQKMERELSFTDGLPMLPADVFAEILDRKYAIVNGSVTFSTEMTV